MKTGSAQSGVPSSELLAMVEGYNLRVGELEKLHRQFQSRHDFITGHLRWMETNLGDPKLPLVEGMVVQANKQQDQSLARQSTLLMEVGDLLWNLVSEPGFHDFFEKGEMCVPKALKLDGQDVDLYTLVRKQGTTG